MFTAVFPAAGKTDDTNASIQALATGKAKHPEAFHFNCASAYTNMQNYEKAVEQVH